MKKSKTFFTNIKKDMQVFDMAVQIDSKLCIRRGKKAKLCIRKGKNK